MNEKVKYILENVQTASVNHQKNIKLLEKVYNSVPFDEFLPYFLNIVQGVLQEDYMNPSCNLLLEFLAKFVGHIVKVHSPVNHEVEFGDDTPTHPFLAAVIRAVVRYHDLPIQECKYNACSFVSQTLQNIGEQTQIDSQICDVIQMAMLENIQDNKPLIRLQAVMALVRLQDPLNPECPVIRAYMTCLNDSSHLVRKEAVKRIAPNALTISKLKDKTTDRDANVRAAAFSHIADIGIRHFKIVHRQFILKSGFNETDRHVKKIFLEYLLPKWLTVLNGEYVAFLHAIKLDAEESDILDTEELSKLILGVFFKTEPINNLIKALPLDENRVIPINIMKIELAHYWNILTKYLRKSDEMDEYLDTVIPELTTFCNYLEKLITTKFAKTMEDWEYLDFQYMLYHLFDIVEYYDVSEEVGRRTLDNLLKKVLRNHRLQPRLLGKIIQIASKLAPSVESFTTEMCLIISDIREPLIEQEPSVYERRDKDFKLAEMKVKLNILEGDLEDAIEAEDFQNAQILKNEIGEHRRRMEALNSQPIEMEKVRVSKHDAETVCWCLDLLGAVLTHSNLKTLSPAMVTCWQEFLKPLSESKNVEVAWRVFKCLTAYCVFDKTMAKEHLKQLLVPIASYRVIPNFNKTVLIASISIITDLIRLHGSQFFGSEEDQNMTSSNQTSTRRRLYNEEVEDVGMITNQMSVELIINVVLDMLDDENDDISDTAITAVTKLMLNGFSVNPMVMTRLILKWYNPMTPKKLQQKLGVLIKEYTDRKRESKEIVAKSVVPILTNIAEAPRTSPLAEVDVENAIRFLAAITDSEHTNNLIHAHRDLAYTLIREVASRPAEVVTPHLARMLNALNIAPDNATCTKELIAQAELLLEREALDKGPKQHIIKFIAKLNGNLTMLTSANVTTTTNNDSAGQSSVDVTKNTTVSRRLSSVIDDPEGEIRANQSEVNEVERSGENISSEGTNGNNADEGNTTDQEKSIRNSNIHNNENELNSENGESQDDQSDIVQTVAPTKNTSEPLNTLTSPPGTDPSSTSDSQEQTVNNLRKRGRPKKNLQTGPSKKKKLETKTTMTTRKNNSSEDTEENQDNEIESDSSDIQNKNQSNSQEISKEVGTNSEETSKRKDTEPGFKTNAKTSHKYKETISQNNKKDKEKEGNNVVAPSIPSNAGSTEICNRRSLRVVLYNGMIPNNVQNNSGKQKDKILNSSDKENSSESQKSVEETSSSDSNMRRVREHSNKQNDDGNSKKSANKKNSLRLRSREKNKTLSRSDSVISNKNKMKSKKANAIQASEENKSQTNNTVNTNSTINGQRARFNGTIVQRDSASESSLSTRSRSRNSSSTSSDLVLENQTRLSKEAIQKQQSKKTTVRTNQQESSNSPLNTSAESRTSNSRKLLENRLRRTNKNNGKTSATKPGSSEQNASWINQMQSKNMRRAKKSVLLNNNRSSSQSSVSDVDEGNNERTRNNKKRDKEVEKRVGGNEVEIRATGVSKTVENLRSTPQVKRKKVRGRLAKNVTIEPIRNISEDLFDTSDQSLHTIIEPPSFQMSLLPDDSPANTPRKSLRNSRKLEVIMSDTSSDSESMNSSVRRSSRNKKI